MSQHHQIFEYLEQLAPIISVPLCWLDINGTFLGGNKSYVRLTGAESLNKLIGKRYEEIYPKEIAEKVTKTLKLIIDNKETIETDEIVNHLATRKPKHFLTIRSPLYDENNLVIGVIVVSVDITQKTEHFNNELKLICHQEYEKFKKFIGQVAHNLRTPIASLSMLEKTCKSLPEEERIILKGVVTKVADIANNLSNYGAEEKDQIGANDFPHILVSLALAEVLSEIKNKYKDLQIKFNCSFKPNSSFAFIKANPWSFNRMITNLVNNSIDAIEGGEGAVDLILDLDKEQIKVIIQDNGKGMPESVVNRIMNNLPVSNSGKKGSGIGFAQARATLQACKGKMLIESQVGKGTKLILIFPRVEAAEWAEDRINLNKGDIVIILDDDHSIHAAWEACFKSYKSDIQLQHFELGVDAIKFVHNQADKDKIFLLADFELINQELDGLQVVEHLSMQKHAALVTGHYDNQKIRDLATKAGVRILPKQLVAEVPVNISGISENIVVQPIDFVIIDDDQTFTDSLTTFLKSQASIAIDTYYNPKRFLENLPQYKKDTKICMDYDLEHQIDGVKLAKQLYKEGYTKLYLLSGKVFNKEEVPSYLTVILKSDVDNFYRLIT